MTGTMVRPPSVRATMNDLAATSLPGWVRVGCLAWALADTNTGHARFATGELRRVLGLSSSRTSDALAIARMHGWIDPASSARCIVLPGCSLNPCEEQHR